MGNIIHPAGSVETESRAAEDLRGLCCRLWDLHETECENISREIYHDIINQVAISRLVIDRALQSPRSLRAANLVHVQSYLHAVIKQLAELSLRLHPQMLEDLGLLAAVAWHIDRFTEQSAIPVDCEYRGMERPFSAEAKTTVFRLVQGVLDMGQAAGAREMAVNMEADPKAVHIRTNYLGCRLLIPSTGLLALKEKVVSGGGRLEIDNRPKSKAFVTIEMPA